MFKRSLPFLLLAFGSVSASAADLVYQAPVVEPVAQSYDWSGIYVGGSIGYIGARSRTTDSSITTSGPLVGIGAGSFDPAETFAGADGSENLDGLIGGVQIGANRQFGAWVYGVEADYQVSRADFSNAFIASDQGPFYESETTLEHLATLRGRLGYAIVDTVVVYGTAGLAAARASGSLSITGGVPGGFTGPTFSDTQKDWQVGYAVGAGVEAAIARSNWTVKAEYLYADFGSKRYDFSFAGSDGSTATTRSNLDAHVVRIGLNYRF